ncbi:MAG TPA: OsmC family protein [Gemmatimonadaceae bacterium]|nr:OsmC family protein [Gemmatimonadaceae bacterium]
MSEYTAQIAWDREGAAFSDQKYSRRHQWRFDGGAVVPASSSPHSVPVPLSDPTAVDPEEAFVASLASCHMLWFLAIAARRGYVVDRYRDDAIGRMERNDQGRLAITVVVLRPAVTFGAAGAPAAQELAAMHHEAHEQCYIASSVRTDVRCEPVVVGGAA